MIKDFKTDRYQALTRMGKGVTEGLRVGLVGERADEPAENDPSITVAELGMIQEFGYGRTPARSFVRAYFDESYTRIFGMLRTAVARAMRTSNPTKAIKDELEVVGQTLAGEMQGRMLRGIEPRNAESTIAKKGFDSPLIDSGQLYAAISYEIEAMVKK